MHCAEKILVIGVDAATMGLIQTWADEGRLPNFKRFLEEGAYGKLNSVPNWNSAPAWSSMVTGVNPGKHGIFWFGEYKPQSYEYFYLNASYRHGSTLWNIMGEAGKKAGVRTIAVCTGVADQELLAEQGPDYVLADLNSLLSFLSELQTTEEK